MEKKKYYVLDYPIRLFNPKVVYMTDEEYAADCQKEKNFQWEEI